MILELENKQTNERSYYGNLLVLLDKSKVEIKQKQSAIYKQIREKGEFNTKTVAIRKLKIIR